MMGKNNGIAPDLQFRSRIVTLMKHSTKTAYDDYCERIGSKPCTRLREFIEAELEQDKMDRAVK